MPGLNVKEIVGAVDGTLEVKGNQNPIFSHFHFDTRQVTRDRTLFFALKTETNDGHRYVRQLADKNGVGAVVSLDYDPIDLSIPLIRVKDPLKAAQQLAAYVRNKYRGIKYIGVTGSAGKTTTKEFIYQLLSHKRKVFRSFKNFNNWIGMPFSILNMKGDEEAAVFELAMSEPGIGEIDLLAKILKPDAAVILNVFPVHLEYLKTIDNVAQGKAEILNYLSPDDAAFINGDSQPLVKRIRDPRYEHLYQGGRKIFFGRNPGNDIRLQDITRLKGRDRDQTRMVIDFYGREAEFVVPLVNRIHIENLFAAIIVVRHLGMKNPEIQEAVSTLTPLADRGVITRHGRFTIINETYNSNPEALKRTLDWVDKEYKRKKNRKRVAVLGDMLELGEGEEEFHREVGRFFAGLGFDGLVTVGKRALKIAEGALEAGFAAQDIQQFPEASQAGKYLKKIAFEWESRSREFEGILLFKASRGIQLENALREFLHESAE
ncbi:MAG: UDP-N-acetylmuramoyl-tripeptide--D-alanyl-D-alanine ligase [Candidatus Aminicenantes bacterium]|nr:MAG: UDP-N-acetylmuramoyl-tripeptide--D-alanyl-D-alanine ligase [Candidatus Aminicenantes bacterium]